MEVVKRAVEERIGIKLAQPPKVKVQATPSPDNQMPRPMRPLQPISAPPISEDPEMIEDAMIAADPMMGESPTDEDPLDQALELPESPE